jgi:hypothetical protein
LFVVLAALSPSPCSLHSPPCPPPLAHNIPESPTKCTYAWGISRINLERNVFCLRCFVSSGPSSWSFLCKGKFVSYPAHCSRLACLTYRQPEHCDLPKEGSLAPKHVGGYVS